jgi:hypothetical protein
VLSLLFCALCCGCSIVVHTVLCLLQCVLSGAVQCGQVPSVGMFVLSCTNIGSIAELYEDHELRVLSVSGV